MSNNLKNIFTQSDCLSEDLLFRYIDNKVSSDERHTVEKHLLDCELCSDALEGLKLINTEKVKNIIGELKSGIYSRTKKSKTKIIEFNYKWAYAIAATLIFLFGISFLFTYILKKEIVAPVVVKNDKIKTEQNEFSGTYNENKTSVLPEKKKEKILHTPSVVSPDKNEEYGNNTVYGTGSQGVTKSGSGKFVIKEKANIYANTSADSINNLSPPAGVKYDETKAITVEQKNEAFGKEINVTASEEKKVKRKAKKAAPSYYDKTSKPAAGYEGNAPVSNTETKDYNTDLKKYEKILKENPDDYSATYNSGISYFNLKKFKEAIDKFDKTIAVGSGEFYEDALWYKALSLISSGKKEDAKIVLDKIISLDKKFKSQAEKKKTELE